MTTISMIIRTFNEEAHIGRLLTGIAKQTVQPEEVILVDSGSTDATLEIARRFLVRIVTIAPEDFTFGRSLNVGCAAATSDLLVIASAHVYPVYDTWLARLTAPFANPNIALVYGRQQGDARSAYSEHQVLARWFPTQSVISQDHPFCNNANAAVRREAWQAMPYDENLTGLEDLDWARRAMAIGRQTAYIAEAAVIHVHQESYRQRLNRYRREAIAHHSIFPAQHMSALDAIRLGIGNILSDYYRAARERVLLRNITSIPRFRVAQFWGSYRGFRQRGPVADRLKRHFYYPNGLHSAPWIDNSAVDRPIAYDTVPAERYGE